MKKMSLGKGDGTQDHQPELSLLAKFDDINRISERLNCGTGEDEFISVAYEHENCRQKWYDTLKAIEAKGLELSKIKKDNDVLQTKLKHARSLFEIETNKRIKVEHEKKSLEGQIAVIKEVLLADQNALGDHMKEKLAFLSTSQSSRNLIDSSPRKLTTIEESAGSELFPSDVSFEKTDDDLELEPGIDQATSKRGRFAASKTSKRQKDTHSAEEGSYSTYMATENKVDQAATYTTLTSGPPSSNTRSKRCCSEPAPNSSLSLPSKQNYKSDGDPFDNKISVDAPPARWIYARTFSESSPFRRFSSSSKMNRHHVFCTKTVIRPEKCLPCGERMRFYKQALKCQDCRVTCHPECKDKVPLPCYPSFHTPDNKGTTGTIADFVPPSSPMIPALLVHCINEIESRGLKERGLYRMSCRGKEVKDLKEKFLKGKSIPPLNKVNMQTLCGAVKDFLQSVQEPLIPRNVWKDFATAAETCPENAIDALCEAITELPQPNRDTIAFLIPHLNRIAESPQCKMPMENLAHVFGPTLLGCSEAVLPQGDVIEKKSQYMVMQLLLKVPNEFWKSISFADDVTQSEAPESKPKNLLLPALDNVSGLNKSHKGQLGKIPLAPRNARRERLTRQKKSFFSSPLLK